MNGTNPRGLATQPQPYDGWPELKTAQDFLVTTVPGYVIRLYGHLAGSLYQLVSLAVFTSVRMILRWLNPIN